MSGILYRDRWDPKSAHLVSLDPCFPEQWRASRFDARGAAGHVECTTRAIAIHEAIAHGADRKSAVEADAGSVDAELERMGIVIGCEA